MCSVTTPDQRLCLNKSVPYRAAFVGAAAVGPTAAGSPWLYSASPTAFNWLRTAVGPKILRAAQAHWPALCYNLWPELSLYSIGCNGNVTTCVACSWLQHTIFPPVSGHLYNTLLHKSRPAACNGEGSTRERMRLQPWPCPLGTAERRGLAFLLSHCFWGGVRCCIGTPPILLRGVFILLCRVR